MVTFADEKTAKAELEALRKFAKTNVAVAAWTAIAANPNWAHGDVDNVNLSSEVASAMSPGAVASVAVAAAAAIAALAIAF